MREHGNVIEGMDEFVAGPTFLTSWAELAAELDLEPEPANDIGFDLAEEVKESRLEAYHVITLGRLTLGFFLSAYLRIMIVLKSM